MAGRARARLKRPRLLGQVIAVEEVGPAAVALEGLGFRRGAHGVRAEWGVEAAMFPLADGGYLEVVAPRDTGRPAAAAVRRFLDRRGEGLYLTSIEVEDVRADHRRLAADGVALLGPPELAPPVNGWRCHLLWIHPRSAAGAFVQLLTYAEPPAPPDDPAPFARIAAVRLAVADPAAAGAALERIAPGLAGFELEAASEPLGAVAVAIEGGAVDERAVVVHGARLEFRRGGTR